MKELSIFIDESGDWGKYDHRCPYYIVTMVFHNQENSISEDVALLEEKLRYLDCENHCIHAGPIIRGEDEYREYEPELRRKLLKHLMTFIRHTDLYIDSVYFEKKHVEDEVIAAGKLAKLLSQYIKEKYDYFNSFDVIKVYYDKGQIELNKVLSTVFNTLFDNVVFKRVQPSDYRLFQVADLACTLKLVELKLERKTISTSELNYFESERILKKNYLKPLNNMKIK